MQFLEHLAPAAAILARSLERPLRYYLFKTLGDDDRAYDVLQELWLHVVRRIRQLVEPAPGAILEQDLVSGGAFKFQAEFGADADGGPVREAGPVGEGLEAVAVAHRDAANDGVVLPIVAGRGHLDAAPRALSPAVGGGALQILRQAEAGRLDVGSSGRLSS